MKLRVAVLVLLVTVLGAVLAAQTLRFKAAETARLVAAREPKGHPALGDFKYDAGQMGRLRPDARALGALGELRRLAGADSAGSVEILFKDDRWWIRCAGAEVGSLSELPDFDEITRLLVDWGRRVSVADSAALAAPGPARPELDAELAALRALPAVRRAGAAWSAGQRDAGLAVRLAAALAWLAQETPDQVGAGDLPAARAWAALALARARTRAPLLREECLLADALGYKAHARRLGTTLPAPDPVRAYLARADSTLARQAQDPRNAAARFLRLRSLARAQRLDDWLEAWGDGVETDSTRGLPWAGTGLELRRFESRETSARLLMAMTIWDLQRAHPQAAVPAEELAGRPAGEAMRLFEAEVDAVTAADATIADRALLQDYYRACFYSGLHALGMHYLEALGSVPAAEGFAEGLGEGLNGPPGEFARWYGHLAEALGGHADVAELRGDVSRLNAFGVPLRLESFEEISHRIPYGDPSARMLGNELISRIDGRPSARLRLASVMQLTLLALTDAERLAAAGVDEAGPEGARQQAWWAAYRGDSARLAALIRAPELRSHERVLAVRALIRLEGVDSAAVEAEFERCVGEAPDDWRVSQAYVDYLSDAKRWDKMRRVAERWLDRHVEGASSFDFIFARTAAARAYYEMGLIARGLQVVGPAAESWQFGALNRQALLLERAGRGEEAEAVARRAARRYPQQPAARATLARLLWAHGRYEKAAEVLTDPSAAIEPLEWVSAMAPHFAEVFKGRRDEARKAADAVRKRGVNPRLVIAPMAQALRKAGDPEHAFRLLEAERMTGMEDVDLALTTYGHLKAWRGDSVATSWMRGRIPRDMKVVLGTLAFSQRHDELLWTLSPVIWKQHLYGDYDWLLRASASLRAADTTHHGELIAYFTQDRGGKAGYYHITGRYLLGLATLDEVVGAAGDDTKRRCETSYFIGLKAQVEGRHRDAAGWYERSVQTGAMENGEYRWAYAQLWSWMSQARSLDRLKPEPPA